MQLSRLTDIYGACQFQTRKAVCRDPLHRLVGIFWSERMGEFRKVSQDAS